MPEPDTVIAAAEGSLHAERAEEARANLKDLGDLASLPPPERDRARLAKLRSDELLGEPIDRLALEAQAALREVADARARARLHHELSSYYAAKRCDKLACDAARAASEALPGSAIGADALGWAHLTFDRRDDARQVYEGALALEDAWRAQLGIARVSYVLGDFERVLATVDAMPVTDATRVAILRWRTAVLRVRTDWEPYLAALDQVIDATRGGFRARWDLAARASALFKLGRRDDALEQYRGIWRDKEGDAPGRFAREVLNHVERGAGKGRSFLPTFPTVTQKRNYCGPAVLELVLRHIGVEVTQDTIAATVKRPEGGSPMVKLGQYLEAQGLGTRRFEGTAVRLRACIELGLPVIVQEEYSTTTHVAVVVGVDEELGLLSIQDPMTHVPAERLVVSEERLGALFRQGALVAWKKGEGLEDKLDAADVKDQEHIRLVDACDEDGVRDKPSEVLKRCSRAIQLCDDYPLAWHRRSYELLSLAQGQPNNRAQLDIFLSMLRAVRVKYGATEWPHQVHARYLMWQNRNEEALIELEDALRLDPGDANNAQYIAELHDGQKRAKEALEAYWRALRIDPSHVRATENFAAFAFREKELELARHLSGCALAMAPKNPFNHITASRVAKADKRREEAVAEARKAVEIDPKWRAARGFLADVLREDAATKEEAVGIYKTLSAEVPGWFQPRLDAAAILRELGRDDEALALLKDGIACAKDEPTDLVDRATDILLAQCKVSDAVGLARSVAEAKKTYSARFAWFKLLAREERQLDAMKLARELVKEYPDHPPTLMDAAESLPREESEAPLRRAVELAPDNVTARARLIFRLLPDRAKEAVEVGLAAPKETAWLLRVRATALNEAGEFDRAAEECKKALAKLGNKGSPRFIVTEYVRALIGDGAPEAALERLRDAAEPIDVRARVALALSTLSAPQAIDASRALPPDDMATARMFIGAMDADESFRPAMEQRVLAVMAAPGATEDEKAELFAVIVGSRAASGETAQLDAFLGRPLRASKILEAIRTLTCIRHPEVRERILAAARAREPESLGVLRADAWTLAAKGDIDGASRLLREMIVRFPLDHGGYEDLGRLQLLQGDEEAHGLFEKAYELASWCYDASSYRALSLLVQGKREEGALATRRARALYAAWGTPLRESAALASCEGVLARSKPALERAASLFLPVRHDAPLWKKLVALAES